MSLKVVIQPSPGRDAQLFYDAVNQATNKSGFISQLALRGWLNLLHGTPAVERSIQARMIGLPDDLIAQIEALAPAPHFLTAQPAQHAQVPAGVQQSAPAGTSAPLTTRSASHETVDRPAHGQAVEQARTEQAPLPAQAEAPRKVFGISSDSMLGDDMGGLA